MVNALKPMMAIGENPLKCKCPNGVNKDPERVISYSDMNNSMNNLKTGIV